MARLSLSKVLFRLQAIVLNSGVTVPPKWGQQGKLTQKSLKVFCLMNLRVQNLNFDVILMSKEPFLRYRGKCPQNRGYTVVKCCSPTSM